MNIFTRIRRWLAGDTPRLSRRINLASSETATERTQPHMRGSYGAPPTIERVGYLPPPEGKTLRPIPVPAPVERPDGWPMYLSWDYSGDLTAANIIAAAEARARHYEQQADEAWRIALMGREWLDERIETLASREPLRWTSRRFH